jgi:4-amino-4-deoxy-L-arabinose transferase-like glycosyltransferase
MGLKIKHYFAEKNNIFTFLGLFLLCAAGFLLRVRNLGTLSFWGDDGHTFIGTLSILEHGVPLLPSGNILYHGILGYYFNVIPVLIFGPTEFAFRITSVAFSILSIIALYFFGKVLANKFVGFLSAGVLAFSTWYIVFAREARYYQALQFFFLVTFLFFYLGFFKEKKPFRILAALCMGLTPLVHGVGIMLLVLFLPLLLYLGKRFFKKEVIIPFVSVLLFNLLLVLNQIFFWQVGRSFYTEETGLRALSGAYFRMPDPFYIIRIYEMFPEMSAVIAAGAFLLIIFTAGLSIRQDVGGSFFHVNELVLPVKRVRVPYNFFLIQIVFWLVIVLVSLGRMYNQQRYIYFLMPVFILIFAYSVYLLSIFIVKSIERIYASSSRERQGMQKRTFAVLLLFFFAVLSIFTVSGIDVVEAIQVADKGHSDPIDTRYSISNVWEVHWDAKTPGETIAKNREDGDIVITTDIYNTPPYSGPVDYWLWTANLVSWAPYQKIGDHVIDDTYGVRVLRSITDLYDILNKHSSENVWVATSYSLFIPEHIDPLIADFFASREQELLLKGRDGVARLYYFPKTDAPFRFNIRDFFAKEQFDVIDLRAADSFTIDFADAQSAGYLASGFSSVEPGIGTWSLRERAVLLFKVQPGQAYILALTARPFAVPARTQEVFLVINGQPLGSHTFDEADAFSTAVFAVPAEYMTDGSGYIEFTYAYTASPADLSLSSDPRQLAVLFREITLTKK